MLFGTGSHGAMIVDAAEDIRSLAPCTLSQGIGRTPP